MYLLKYPYILYQFLQLFPHQYLDIPIFVLMAALH
jgi:hypothetical protein